MAMAMCFYTRPRTPFIRKFRLEGPIERKSCNGELTFDEPNFLNNRSREVCKMELGRDTEEAQGGGGGGALQNDQLRWEDVIAVSVPLLLKFRNIYSGTIIALY
jgi:hypothetical protein